MRTILEAPAVQRRRDRFGPTQHFLVVVVTAASMLVSTAGAATAASATPGPSTLQTATPRTLQQPTYLGIGTLGALGAAQDSNGFTDGTTDATSVGTGKN